MFLISVSYLQLDSRSQADCGFFNWLYMYDAVLITNDKNTVFVLDSHAVPSQCQAESHQGSLTLRSSIIHLGLWRINLTYGINLKGVQYGKSLKTDKTYLQIMELEVVTFVFINFEVYTSWPLRSVSYLREEIYLCRIGKREKNGMKESDCNIRN